MLVTSAVVALSSCGEFGGSSSQGFDPGMNPLDSPGNRNYDDAVEVGPKFTPGTWVVVTDSNAGFYDKLPRGNDQASYRLKTGTPLKVIGGQGSYVKIETEAGEIGFVPAIMVGTQPAATGEELPIVPIDPSAPTAPVDPLDTIDPVDPTPVPSDGFTAPEPEIPPISVEDAPNPTNPTPIVPPDPVGEDGGE